jgi:predicted permease
MEIEKLIEKRDREITGFFWLGLQIAFIFGIPAFLALFINKKITANTGNNYMVISLIGTFILSWIIVIFIYQKKSKRLKALENEIKRLRKEGNIK